MVSGCNHLMANNSSSSRFLLCHLVLDAAFLNGPPRFLLLPYCPSLNGYLGDSHTSWVPVKFCVPQGSVLGSLLYIMVTAGVPSLFTKLLSSGHLTDDVQAFFSFSFY